MRSQGHTIRPSRAENFKRNTHTHTLNYICTPEGSYLLIGVRPVKAQEEVGSFEVEEEVSCPEWDGEAVDSAAEVKCDPEVLSISIYKDVLQERTDNLREASGQSHQAPKPCASAPVPGATALTGFHLFLYIS